MDDALKSSYPAMFPVDSRDSNILLMRSCRLALCKNIVINNGFIKMQLFHKKLNLKLYY